MRWIHFMISAVLITTGLAGFAPELEPLARQHLEKAAALSGERGKEQAKIAERYTMDLETAEAKATEDGEVDLVKFLQEEIKRGKKGPLPEEPPAILPRRLQGSRRAYLRAYGKMDGDFGKRRKEMDSAYLAQLGKLQKDHAGKAELAEQIASEKERVLAGAWGPITDLRIGLSGSRWLNNNNGTDTRTFGRDGLVDGNANWKYEVKDRVTVVIHWGGDNHMPMHLKEDGKTLADYNGTWTLLPREEPKP